MQAAPAMTTVDQPRFTHAMSEFPSGVTVVVCRNRDGEMARWSARLFLPSHPCRWTRPWC